MSDLIANVGDTVYWSTMTDNRTGKVVKATAKSVVVEFKADKYADAASVTLKREFPMYGQLKGRFSQFKLAR